MFHVFICLILQVRFDDILAEPEGAHSHDCVWGCAYKCFNCAFGCCYKLLTIFLAIPAAFLWGCEFAVLAFSHVWCYTPRFKIFTLQCIFIRKVYTVCLEGCCVPCFEACGAVFSKIVVKQG